jgi:hypothetical protein
VKLELTSDRAQTVDGLGVFAEGETRVFTQEEVDAHFQMLGVPSELDNLAEGLTATAVVGGDE